MSSSGGGGPAVSGGVVVSYEYGTEDKSSGSRKPPMFNRYPDTFSWWKTKMYSHIMGLGEELWEFVEDGFGDLELYQGADVDKKKHTAAQ